MKIAVQKTLKNDKRAEWKIVKNAKLSSRKNFVVKFNEFLKSDESCVTGAELISRAKKLGRQAGQIHAKLMIEQQNIPAELEKFVLLFTGTIWYHPDGYQCIPCLRMKYSDSRAEGMGVAFIDAPIYNGKWIIDFVRLDRKLLNPSRIATLE